MPGHEQADVERHVLHTVEEEHDAEQEQDVVVPGDHVLGAEIGEGDQVDAPDLLDAARVAFGDVVGGGLARDQGEGREGEGEHPRRGP